MFTTSPVLSLHSVCVVPIVGEVKFFLLNKHITSLWKCESRSYRREFLTQCQKKKELVSTRNVCIVLSSGIYGVVSVCFHLPCLKDLWTLSLLVVITCAAAVVTNALHWILVVLWYSVFIKPSRTDQCGTILLQHCHILAMLIVVVCCSFTHVGYAISKKQYTCCSWKSRVILKAMIFLAGIFYCVS